MSRLHSTVVRLSAVVLTLMCGCASGRTTIDYGLTDRHPVPRAARCESPAPIASASRFRTWNAGTFRLRWTTVTLEVRGCWRGGRIAKWSGAQLKTMDGEHDGKRIFLHSR